ncbi:MAG: hypothetical protein PHH40_02095 [Candidatus Moranbacteria bacterium]|nr:hypothetical protein [Candidatus Moranbacteria bacterium]MDD3964989.1 hypothetical protein [Candidatus Moranbacteria bacterium]
MMRIILFLLALLLTGCATLGGNTMAVANEFGAKTEVSLDPISFIGIRETEAIRSGRFSAVLGNFPDALMAEMHPLRMRYNAIAFGVTTGKEYPAQALYTGYAECALRLVFIVEGNIDEPVVGAFADTRMTRLWSLYGDEITLERPEKLTSDSAYRRDMVRAGGTDISRLKKIATEGKSGLSSVFAGWNTVRTKALPYDIRTPLAEQFVRGVARENPELSFSEKLIGNGHFGITLDWFSSAMGAASDVLMSAGASDKGWDEQSELKRGYQGMIARIVKMQYEGAIKNGMLCGKKQTVPY